MQYATFLKKNKKIVTTIFAAGLLAAISIVSTVSADGPVFNIFPIAYDGSLNTDYPLLDGRNATRNEGWSVSQFDHDAGVNTDPGDVVEFLIYYHNGAPDDLANVARNVILRASMPTGPSTQFTVGASISADNATTVTSATRGGDVNVRVSGTQTQTLSLVTGSTIWMPNRGTSQQVMPDTITTSGINIGNINGCWQFSGFVKFRARVSSSVAPASLTINKEVRNFSSTLWVDSVAAQPDSQVEFRVSITNPSPTSVGHVFASDLLPSRITYVPGSLTVSQPTLSGDFFSFSGLDTGAVGPGASVILTFRGQIAPATQFPVGQTNLVNSASTWGTNPAVATISDTATVTVTINPTPQPCSILVRATFNGAPWSGTLNYSITGPTQINDSVVPKDFVNVVAGSYSASYISGGPSGAIFNGVTPASGVCPESGSLTFTYQFSQVLVADLSIDKQVRNVTTGTAYANSVNAEPSQVIEFKIEIRNTGNTTVNSVIARDTLPQNMTYVSGSATVDGVAVTCETCLFQFGLPVGNFLANQTKVIVFRTTLAGPTAFPVGSTTLINTGFTSATSIAEKSDTASVVVNKANPVKQNGDPGSRPN